MQKKKKWIKLMIVFCMAVFFSYTVAAAMDG